MDTCLPVFFLTETNPLHRRIRSFILLSIILHGIDNLMFMKKPYSILFVCLGNICRSPSAEAVFRALVKKKTAEEDFYIDSAGTSAYHEGEKADQRMQKHAVKRGYDLTSISRQFQPGDFEKFDLIIAMDDTNYYELKEQARSVEEENKIVKMTDFSRKYEYDHIPDPYFGGAEGFELVLDLLEDAAEGLYESIEEKSSE